jgi:hypothetical protein
MGDQDDGEDAGDQSDTLTDDLPDTGDSLSFEEDWLTYLESEEVPGNVSGVDPSLSDHEEAQS